MHHIPDALYSTITYIWDWKRSTWLAVVGGLVIVAEAATAKDIVAQAWAWVEEE